MSNMFSIDIMIRDLVQGLIGHYANLTGVTVSVSELTLLVMSVLTVFTTIFIIKTVVAVVRYVFQI